MSTPTIEDAIEALRRLSPQRQRELAPFICHLAADPREAEEIEPADLAAVMEGVEQAKRRQFASAERVAAILGLEQK